MPVRGIRGATTILGDKPEEILEATIELLQEIKKVNSIMETQDIASILFTVTNDLCTEYPAKAARQLGWVDVPLMCAQEIPVPGSLARCIRILIHWNTEKDQNQIRHVYLREARSLRPDINTGVKKLD